MREGRDSGLEPTSGVDKEDETREEGKTKGKSHLLTGERVVLPGFIVPKRSVPRQPACLVLGGPSRPNVS